MSTDKQLQVIQSVLNAPFKEDNRALYTSRKQEIADWFAENEHLLEVEVKDTVEDEIHREDAALIKEYYYNIDDTRKGGKIKPKYNNFEQANKVTKSNRYSNEYVMGTYFDFKGIERKIYDTGGKLGAVERAHSESIVTGDHESVGRDGLFEQGVNHGEGHVTDEHGNSVGFMTTEEQVAHEKLIKAQAQADAEFLRHRFENRRPLEVEMRDRARYYYTLVYNRIKKCSNYREMKRLIYSSRKIVMAGLRRDFPEKVTARGGIFIYPPVKYGTTDENLTNMNFLFHKVESQKLWKAVDESSWKVKHLERLNKARAAFSSLMSKIDILPNPLDQAGLITDNKVSLSKADAELVLVHARSRSNRDRLSKPVYDAVMSKAA